MGVRYAKLLHRLQYLILCRFLAFPSPSFAQRRNTSYSVERAGHEHVELAFVTRAPVSQNLHAAYKPSCSGSSAFSVVVSFASQLRTARFMGDA